MKKRILSLFLAVITIMGLFVVPASAVDLPAVSSSKYISCYTLSTSGKVYAYKEDELKNKTGGYIDCSTDECRIIEFSGTAVRVSYPVSGGRKTAWFDHEAFTKRDWAVRGPQSKMTATKQITTYKRQSCSSDVKYGYISKGDVIYVNKEYDDVTQVIYPTGSTYKMAWVLTSDLYGTQNSTEAAVQARLDKIANGTLKYNSDTVLQVGKTFVGYRENEQCKGYAKDVFELCFGITPGSTQAKPNNHLLNSTSGMTKVGSVTSMTNSNVKALFSKARPGDFVQIRRSHGGSHSAIVYSVSSDGVTFLEANLDGKNTIYKKTYTWSSLCSSNAKMSVYTATNYKLK
ncbi:MAG: hypothetical protein ACI3U8_08395 [Candidatus Onthomonas sp.]